jgi:hypothetical protein
MSLDFNKKYLNKSNGDMNRNKVSIIIENEKFDRENFKGKRRDSFPISN